MVGNAVFIFLLKNVKAKFKNLKILQKLFFRKQNWQKIQDKTNQNSPKICPE